jgi:hypothetical protein
MLTRPELRVIGWLGISGIFGGVDACVGLARG